MRKAIKKIGICSLLTLGVLLSGCGGGSKTRHGLEKVDWLPSSASKINVFETWGLANTKIYECSIPEKEFRTFASQKNWPLVETNDVYVIFRHVLRLEPLRTINGAQINLVPHALFFERKAKNGGGITVVYDLETKRLFVDSSNR